MHLGYSWCEKEMRIPGQRTFKALKKSLEDGFKEAGLDYVDLWRVTCFEDSGRHTDAEIEELMKALEWAKKSGMARFTGISSHDRPHIKRLITHYPQQLDVIVTPYTAKTKLVEDEVGLWSAMKKLDVGWFGIKPFASNSIFKGTSKPGDPHEEEDSRIARLGHPLHPLQSGHHGPHTGPDHGGPSGQRGHGRGRAPRTGHGGKGRIGAGHGSRLGQSALPLPVAQGLGIRLKERPVGSLPGDASWPSLDVGCCC